MNSLKLRQIYSEQSGIVSILVVSILTITLSLIAIGFSKLADRELRQASDREQSSQAYYAAQSGLNDAIAYIADGGSSFPGCSTTGASPNPSLYFTPDISGSSGTAKYSCISVDNTPTVLMTPVSPGQPELLKVSDNSNSLKNLYIAWQNTDGTSKWLPGVGGSYPLPTEDSVQGSGATGLLRVGLYKVPKSAGSPCNTNNCLTGLSRAYYLYPNGLAGNPPGAVPYSGGTNSYAGGPGGNNGSFVPGNCDTNAPNPVPANSQAGAHYCNSEITGLDGTNYNYYLYLTAQYAQVSVTVQGTDGGTPPTPVKFVDSQATVDVTGQASGVIQRIKAQVNIGSSFGLPNYGVQSMETLCKNFYVDVTAGNGTGPTQYGPAHLNETSLDPACVAPPGNQGNINIVGGGGVGTSGH